MKPMASRQRAITARPSAFSPVSARLVPPVVARPAARVVDDVLVVPGTLDDVVVVVEEVVVVVGAVVEVVGTVVVVVVTVPAGA